MDNILDLKRNPKSCIYINFIYFQERGQNEHMDHYINMDVLEQEKTRINSKLDQVNQSSNIVSMHF